MESINGTGSLNVEASIELMQSDNAVQIGGTGYSNLKEAIDAVAEGQTILLLKDITESVKITKDISFAALNV